MRSTPRCWRTAHDCFLIESLSDVRIVDAEGAAHQGRSYTRINREGKVVTSYAPFCGVDSDNMLVETYAVEGDELVAMVLWTSMYSSKTKQEVRLTGMVEIASPLEEPVLGDYLRSQMGEGHT